MPISVPCCCLVEARVMMLFCSGFRFRPQGRVLVLGFARAFSCVWVSFNFHVSARRTTLNLVNAAVRPSGRPIGNVANRARTLSRSLARWQHTPRDTSSRRAYGVTLSHVQTRSVLPLSRLLRSTRDRRLSRALAARPGGRVTA